MKDLDNKTNDLEKKELLDDDKDTGNKEISAAEVIENAEVMEEGLEITETEELKQEFEPMESIVELETTYDYRTLKYANMYIIRVKRKSRMMSSIMVLISLIVGVLIFFFMPDSRWLSYVFLALVLFSVYNMVIEESKIDRSLANFFATHPSFKQTFYINDEKIRVKITNDGEEKIADYPWPYINEINAIPEFYFLFINRSSPLVIDRNEAVILKGNQEKLDDIIRSKVEFKPYKYYDKPFFKKKVSANYEATEVVSQTTEDENKK